jgi:hypothetical protein
VLVTVVLPQLLDCRCRLYIESLLPIALCLSFILPISCIHYGSSFMVTDKCFCEILYGLIVLKFLHILIVITPLILKLLTLQKCIFLRMYVTFCMFIDVRNVLYVYRWSVRRREWRIEWHMLFLHRALEQTYSFFFKFACFRYMTVPLGKQVPSCTASDPRKKFFVFITVGSPSRM